MGTIQIQVKRELFRFDNQAQWVSKAQSWFRECGVPRDAYICVDAVGRVCTKGKEFNRAMREETYPIVVYELGDLGQLKGDNRHIEGIEWKPQGDANEYALVRGNQWVAHIRMNGELTVPAQEAILGAMLERRNG